MKRKDTKVKKFKGKMSQKEIDALEELKPVISGTAIAKATADKIKKDISKSFGIPLSKMNKMSVPKLLQLQSELHEKAPRKTSEKVDGKRVVYPKGTPSPADVARTKAELRSIPTTIVDSKKAKGGEPKIVGPVQVIVEEFGPNMIDKISKKIEKEGKDPRDPQNLWKEIEFLRSPKKKGKTPPKIVGGSEGRQIFTPNLDGKRTQGKEIKFVKGNIPEEYMDWGPTRPDVSWDPEVPQISPIIREPGSQPVQAEYKMVDIKHPKKGLWQKFKGLFSMKKKKTEQPRGPTTQELRGQVNAMKKRAKGEK